ncbi:PfkB family carbohydrate kinase [Microbacterium sp. NC79]|uniref:PfkB family carbohydrate kinase n=1 Tax=Microbacterium sp. NC79 TaxID=2851009 RepID=UPI001C2C3FB3|nr:PfkB family carbohydrate kinase [Microbacterium sp. NC79]MBV0895638.1 bifunctional hydroxymethylpyrimidine kinase/phosphomethylpyrimidine kinase [Microbacterium sp. NC79]
MSRVVSTGSIIVDLTVTVPAVPVPGGDVLASPLRALVGGGFNLVAAASRHGAHVVYAGVIGTGPYGQLASAALAAEGISRVPGTAATGDTGVCITLVDANAERTFITSPGAESRLTPEHLDAVRPKPDDVVCVSGYDAVYEGSRDALTEWVMSLPLGTTIVFDPGPLVSEIPESVWNALLSRTDVLTLNDQEAERLTPGVVPADQHFALRERLRLRPETATVIRRGSAGCTWRSNSAHGHVSAPRVVAVDTTGAGDTHTGTMAAALAEGFDLPTALRRANVAAADSVTRQGPATAPTRAQLDALLTRVSR